MFSLTTPSWQRSLLLAIVVSATWIFASVGVSADMRIEIGDEEFTQQLWLKDSFIRITEPDMHILVDCRAQTVALLAPQANRYWQGTVNEFRDELNALFAMLAGSLELFDMFSTTNLPSVSVRTTRIGTDTVAGYDAVHYAVEYEVNGTWHVLEEAWIAPTLLQEIEAETGRCMNTVVHDFMLTMLQLQLFGWASDDPVLSVITSPEYTALSEEGFTVRSLSVIEMFDIRIEALTEVKDVSKEPLDDALFVIPDDYEPMTLLEAIS